MEIKINKDYLLSTLKDILLENSPTGFCFEIIDKIEKIVEELGYSFEKTN